MKILILLIVTGIVNAEDPLRSVLRSAKETLSFYGQFKAQRGIVYTELEDRVRFRLFRSNAEKVASYNEEKDETAVYELNFFSTMTDEERQQYLGLNVTGHESNPADDSGRSVSQLPSSLLWTSKDKSGVTAVKNQGSCGSCWSFGAVGGLETRYKIQGKKLKSFAEQEYLDCVYEGKRDGCQGGWMSDAYQYSAKNGGRLATTRNYPYKAKDGKCLKRSKTDGMIAFKIRGNVGIKKSEDAHIEALQDGSVTVAFEVTNKCQQYAGGIFRDTTCRGSANHAVTAVGYTPTYILVKNSWSARWGDKGFIKFARNYHNCKLYMYSSYPKLDATGKKDTDPEDTAADYNPDDGIDPEPEPDNCVNKWSDRKCKIQKMLGRCKKNKTKKNCNKTCGACPDCPSGTIRCPDGVCRHEHMC